MSDPTPCSPPLRSPTVSSFSPPLTCFTNCLLCLHGELLPQDLYFSPETGLITPNYYFRAENVKRIDLGGRVVAPGYLNLQTNGMSGVHFTNLGKGGCSDDEESLLKVARMQLQAGVTGFWATIPTVSPSRWKEILPILRSRTFPNGADLLGAHVEGPYLASSKKGAHNEAFFVKATDVPPEEIYGSENLNEGPIKMITLAPELPGTVALIGHLHENYPHIAISLGHSAATYSDGMAALDVGAKMMTHVFNAMLPLNHRQPGLAGLMAGEKAWYSVIPDGIHLHPSVLALAMRASSSKCIFITDSIELAGLPDGVHEGHGQIGGKQRKEGNKVTLVGTDTLVGSCIRLDECVRNVVEFTKCSLAEAVRCVTENVADMIGEGKRGSLEPGRRADLVVLSEAGFVEETWMEGKKVWTKEDGG